MYRKWKNRISQLLHEAGDLGPVRWFLDHQRHIAWVMYVLLMAGGGYWVYHMSVIDARPQTDLIFSARDTRDALVYAVFGIFGIGAASLAFFFILKFIFNVFHEGIYNSFPAGSQPLVKAVCGLTILSLAFLYAGNIKAAGLTAYEQVTGIVHAARQHDDVAAQNVSHLADMINIIKNGGSKAPAE